jgi:bifunctional DNA-binding transcriptional regulator/antitoxin component of YhaV-PrlF toxin-antitoxin module
VVNGRARPACRPLRHILEETKDRESVDERAHRDSGAIPFSEKHHFFRNPSVFSPARHLNLLALPQRINSSTVQLLNMAVEIVKMSAKGQLVVPQSVREELGLSTGERFVAVPIGRDVLFKRTEFDLEALAQRTRRRFSRLGITKKDVAEAVRCARKSSSTRTS